MDGQNGAMPQIDPNSIQPLSGGPSGPTAGGGLSSVQIDPNSIQRLPGVSFPSAPQQAQSAGAGEPDLQTNPDDSFATTALKDTNAVGAGIGSAMLDTVNGGLDLVNNVAHKVTGANNLIPHQLLEDRSAELKRSNAGNPLANAVGYGGETLVEFIMGDAAIKALPLSEGLELASKWMKTAQKSPRLIQAMKIGAAALKAGELTPQETALLKQSPAIEKFVIEGLKAAGVQGVQSTLRTGGDLKQAALDAAITGAAGGAGAAALGGAGKMLARGGKAAKTVADMSEMAAGAQSHQGVTSELGDQLKEAQGSIDDIFEKAKQSAEDTKNAAQSVAEGESLARKDAANSDLASGKGALEDMSREHEDQIATEKESRSQWIQKGLQEAHSDASGKLVSGLDKLAGPEPVDTEDLAKNVNEGLNGLEADSHTQFEEGITGENGIVPRTQGVSNPVLGGKISNAAGELFNTPDPDEHEAVVEAMVGAGDKLDPKLLTMLKNLAKGSQTVGEGKDAVEKPYKPWTAEGVIKFRQMLRKWAAPLPRGDINRNVLGKLMGAADDEMEDIAAKAQHEGGEDAGDVVSDLQKLRQTYKGQRQLLDSNTADKLRLNAPDKALNDVNEYLTRGQNSVAKINTIRKIMGDGNMQDLGRSQVGTWRDLAQTDPAKFVKDFNGMKAPAREALFGPEMAKELQNLADTYSQSVKYADNQAADLTNAAKSDLKEYTHDARSSIQKAGQNLNSDHAQRVSEINSKYDEAVQAAKDAFNTTTSTAKDQHTTASAPFRSFLNSLAEGRPNDSLFKGDVDLKDIQNIKDVIGPDKWKSIADGIFQRAVGDASPKGQFNPETMVNWWEGIKPEVRSEFFSMSDPNTVRQYQAVMDQVKDSASVKRMLRNFGIKPVVLGTGYAAGGVAGAFLGHFAGFIPEIIAGLSGAASGGKLAAQTIEWISDHPGTWSKLRTASEVTEKVAGTKAGKAAVKAAPYVPGAIRSTYQGLSKSLGGS